MKTSLKSVLLMLALFITLAPIICVVLFSEVVSSSMKELSLKNLEEATLANTIKTNSDIIRMCELILVSDKTFAESVKKTSMDSLKNLGDISLDTNVVEREIRNPNDSLHKWKEKLRLLKLGKTVIDCDQAENKDSPINQLLESLKKRLKCDFTIFVRISPNSNDFLSIASTHTDSNGENIAGTLFSGHSNQQREKVIKAIVNNTEYSGLINTPTSTMSVNFFPLNDANGKVIGAIYFGLENNSIKEISRYISGANIGKGVQAWIIDDSSPDNPIVKFSEQANENSMSIKDSVSTVRKNLAYEIIEKSRTLKAGQISYEIFTSKTDPSKKTILTYAYFHPWNWIVGIVTNSDEYTLGASAIAKNFQFEFSTILYVTILSLISAIFLGLFISKKIIRNLNLATLAIQKIVEVNPASSLAILEKTQSENINAFEFETLIEPIIHIAKRLENILCEIDRDISNLKKSTSEITSNSEELGKISSTELTQMKDIAKAGRNILLSAEQLNKTTQLSATEIQKSLLLNKGSENAIDILMRKYDTLAVASSNVSKKLANINENAEKITALITAISDVSLKTNMLSLNASIEAEKVGETGLGFAVVSRQIRLLADKTSKTSHDIEKIVRQMQSSVNSAVMEMDSFSANMRTNSAITIKTAKKLSSTISNIEAIGPKFENISARISDMSKIAIDITESIKNLLFESTEIQNTLTKLLTQNSQINVKSKDIAKTIYTIQSPTKQ